MLKAISSEAIESFDEKKAEVLLKEKSDLQARLSQIAETEQQRENTESRLDDIYTILDGLKKRPMQSTNYTFGIIDKIVRQIIECVVVESKDEIKVIFIGGLEVTEQLIEIEVK